MKNRRIIGIMLVIVMLFTICTMNVSAACNIGHGSAFIVEYCTESYYDDEEVTCYWQGGYGGGVFHGTNCQIKQVWNYTAEVCLADGCTYNAGTGQHWCYTYHSQSPEIGNIDRCTLPTYSQVMEQNPF